MTTMTEEPTTALTGTPTWSPLDIPAVHTPKDEQFVTDYMNLAKAFQTKVKDFFKPHKDRAYAAWKGLCNAENDALRTALATENECKRVLGAYALETEERLRQERFRLEEIARKEEEERRVQEAAAMETQASATVDLVEAHEIRREAEALLEAPITPVVHVESAPKAKGTVYKDKWRGVMLVPAKDKEKLLIAVAERCKERPELLALFDLNDAQAHKLADMVKVHEKEILPGLVCVREINVSGRNR